MSRPGAYAEFMSIPASSVIPVPDDMPHTIAVLTEPAATVLHALNISLPKMARPVQECKVLVIGGGAIGLLSVGGGSFGAYAVGGGAVGTQIAIGGSASAPLAIGSQAASGALTFGPGADPAAVTAAIRQAAAAAPVWLQDLLISLALGV